jgi:predicted amidohydrolase
MNHGAAGVYGPPDLGFPESGVLAQGVMNEPDWVYADIDPEAVARVRREGAVLNLHHWNDQPGAGPLAARIVSLV